MRIPVAFLENLIDACVMESDFREHMRNLLFHDALIPHRVTYNSAASDATQR